MPLKINGVELPITGNELDTANQTKYSLADLIGECSSLGEASWLAAAFKNRGIRAQDFESAAHFRGIEKQLKEQLETTRDSVEAQAAARIEAITADAADRSFSKLVARLSQGATDLPYHQ